MMILLLLALALAMIYTVYKTQKINATTVGLKMLCSTAFLLIPIWGGALEGPWGYPHYVFVGLVLAFWGDLWLELKLLWVKTDAVYSYLGFGSFILTHLCYLMALTVAFEPPVGVWGLAVAVALLIVAFVKLTERPMGLDYGRFRPITLVYTGVLGCGFALALLLAWQSSALAPGQDWFLAGIILFLVSDLALSQLYFGAQRWVKSHIAVNCLTYYVGQIAIAYSTVLWVGH
ncbi:MAG: lysoplasmalogenase family protein [Neisseriaceae bacterium]